MLRERYDLAISTANIRKMLHRFEERGYLFKPHVSAGRIPTDLGYRFYVDRLRGVEPPNRRVADEIRSAIVWDWDEIRDVLSRTSRLLGDLTNYLGLIMGIFRSYYIVERIRIVQAEGRKAVVRLKLFPEMERKVSIEFQKRYSPHIIDRAAQIMNERIAGHPLGEARERLEAFLQDGTGNEREIARALSSEAEYLFDWPYDIEYHFRGFDAAASDTEFNNPMLLRNLVRLMGERSLMLKALKHRMDRDVMVTIGSENEMAELENLAVVTHRFRAGECEGLLGILGPTRMSYVLVLSVLRRLAEELQRL
jgi:heat-inducible transcriptional repressor